MVSEKWTDLHPDFDKKYYFQRKDSKTCQQYWEEAGFTYQDAQEWLAVGFETETNIYYVLNWKNLNLTALEAQEWINIGLEKREYQLAHYCKTKQLAPVEVKDNLEQYRTKLKQKLKGKLLSAQAYFDFFYPIEQRSNIRSLDINQKNLTGNLNLTGFNNLTKLDCSSKVGIGKIISPKEVKSK